MNTRSDEIDDDYYSEIDADEEYERQQRRESAEYNEWKEK